MPPPEDRAGPRPASPGDGDPGAAAGGGRDHGDGRPTGAEPALPPSRDGSVIMDVGGDIGALVLHTGAALDGAEIDLFRPGDDRPCVHSAVRARHLAGGTCYAAVYPQLPAGHYVVAAHLGSPARPVTVEGGRITELGP